MKVWQAKNDKETCQGCRFLHGREIREGRCPSPPHSRCKNPNGCRCEEVDAEEVAAREEAEAAADPRPRRLLWVGDAVVASGFAKCTHGTLQTLAKSWEVHVLGINYIGDPHDYPYKIYPAMPGGDGFGVNRLAQLATTLKPDLVVLQTDPWNVPYYLKKTGHLPVVASMPVDGKNCRGRALNGLAGAIFWTQFGLDEARRGGYTGPAEVVPLGVDLDLFRPAPRDEARSQLPASLRDAFIVGNVNRNQPRKRLDLTIAYFAEWIKTRDVRDAWLYLHVAPTGDLGYDVVQMAEYFGISNRLIVAEPNIGMGISPEGLVRTYQLFDVQVSTTQGEGWGLSTMEGMACGIPQVVPQWAALGEWCGDAAVQVPVGEICVTPNNVNAVGAVADRAKFIHALDALYRNEELRDVYRRRGRALVERPEYRWDNIGERFAAALDAAVGPVRPTALALTQ